MAPQSFAEAVLPRVLVGGDRLSDPTSTLQSRDDGNSASGHNRPQKIVIFALSAILTVIILFFVLRHLYVRYVLERHAYHKAGHDDDERHHRHYPTTSQANLQYALSDSHAQPDINNNSSSSNNNNNNTAAGVDRSTSIRSVMTLPVYRPKPSENELVLGREGERDGIDVVVEMQTAEEEEALRDEEMEAMYRIRAARRRQLEEREARREARRRAREANDEAALRQLREEARASAERGNSEIEELRDEHERIRAAARQRAVSSVSYADVGIARADGTRVRANSAESTERVGLLSDAASIAADSLFRRRDRSASATLSIDTSLTAHGRPESPGLSTGGYSWGNAAAAAAATAGGQTSRSRASSAGTTAPRIPTPSPGIPTPRAGSPPEIIEPGDVGDMGMPPPPGYDEVSLGELTPLHSRRNSDAPRPASPYPDPPPEYPGQGPAERRTNRLSARMEELAAQQTQAQADESAAGAAAAEGTTRPNQVPQIVIDPSGARP
ncbi:hypothetical protein MYCTH_2295311 [Thermothelomyces thermophilus ATCC 42464]|uniref:Uncharacterized protein n=1 Tax=Thermothelomyces thermophilus (strain ATCC 42464 / BCRC 31852 / DSM 1799) TaxID=573729 RepID=G2Q4H1_THET4|nr:uncharacterized protein MYCTH_2295311 [Thermothelomyces thermophilus ATCC 42464]AEO53664.1 hypothetical protein MYCTH_2295311 [Thermothelomyces thermophilus ATCC 42464]